MKANAARADSVQPVLNMNNQPDTTTPKPVVIKFGGNALDETTGRAFCQTVAKLPTLGFAPIVVHGGGPQINAMLAALGIAPRFVDGLRYTDAETLKIAEMVLSGHVNKQLVQFLGDNDMLAVGISGKDGKTLIAEKLNQNEQGKSIDLGFVGKVIEVRPTLIKTLMRQGFVPVIAPLAQGTDGQTYNINADYAAADIAKTINAAHFIMMTNISGLLDTNQQIIHHATTKDIHTLIADGVIAGGMIPKTLSAVDTLKNVGEVNIIDGRKAENLFAVLKGHKVGTRITNE